MALSFPTSPAAGDQYIAPNGITYTWNATLSTWTSTGVSGAGGGGGGGVTSVTGTAPIVSSGGATPAISLQTSGVAAGSYTLSNITVDTFGRVTSASSGTAPGNGTIQVNQGGVSKGSFTVNQTGNTTINLDAGYFSTQTWQDVTASRVAGTTYTNNTGNVIMVNIKSVVNNTGSAGGNLTVDGIVVGTTIGFAGAIGMGQGMTMSAIVPNGSTYSLDQTVSSSWYELR